MNINNDIERNFGRLVKIMDELRSKCPWDKKQTIHTLRSMTIEETYELAEAIINEDWPNIKEELGDILLHIVFYAKIASEQAQFTLGEVIDAINDKLIARHPHIYGDLQVNSEEDVKRNWEKIKILKGRESVLDGVPVSLPALVKATRIQEKAKQAGFEWNNKEDVWKKVEEEMKELHEVVIDGDRTKIEEEFGDLMFSFINYGRFLKVDAESALEKTNKKFVTRFTQMEQVAVSDGKSLASTTLEEMDIIWDRIKQENRMA